MSDAARDILSSWVQAPCPRCGYEVELQLSDAVTQAYMWCPCCRALIQLVDETGSVSVAITSNLVFSEWDKIFKDPMTTASAIDRVVHHSIIIEFGKEMKSVRAEQAAQRNAEARSG